MTPRFEDHRKHAEEAVRAILHAADPAAAIRRNWTPPPRVPTLLLAIGKASRAMAEAALKLLDVPELRGVVTTPPELAAPIDPRVTVYPCDHPLPTGRNVVAAQAVVDAIHAMHARHGAVWQVLFLVSGGGSAHLTLPTPPLTLDDLRHLNEDLQRAGANIAELNAVRKRTEQLKGGRLGLLVHPAPITLLVASDVIGDAIDVIASGPVTGDQSCVSDATSIMQSRGLQGRHSAVEAILNDIEEGRAEDTPGPGDPRLAPVDARIVCSNSDAAAAARDSALSMGFDETAVVLGLTGETRAVAERFISSFPGRLPACRVAGGETTVTVGSAGGKGGPSQEFALVCALEMEHRFLAGGVRSALVAFSTDGVDGPTDAAGALVTHETCRAMRTRGVDPAHALAAHDSRTALDAVGALIKTGPTGTNVNHVAALFVYSEP